MCKVAGRSTQPCRAGGNTQWDANIPSRPISAVGESSITMPSVLDPRLPLRLPALRLGLLVLRLSSSDRDVELCLLRHELSVLRRTVKKPPLMASVL